jgi:tetratricopeptide (TPR) repeat protein
MPGLHTALADIYRKTGHDDWARIEESREAPVRRQAADPPPGSAEFSYRQAKRYEAQALEAFQRLGQLPPSAEIHELLAEAYRIQGHHRESVHELRQALALDPSNPRLRRELARSLWLNRDFEAAQALLAPLVQSEPASAETSYQLGDSLLQLGDVEGAIKFLAVAVRRAPKLLAAHAALGRAFLRAGRTEDAARHLETALSTDEDGSLHYQLSQAYTQLGRQAEASQMLSEYEKISAARRVRDQERNQERRITPP